MATPWVEYAWRYSRRYEMRYNTVKQVTEFRTNDLRFKPWEPLTDRELKSIVVEEMKEGGESWYPI